ncbi:MAG TPA: NAD(+) diphosphatase [Geobacteraceae bacterium]
MIYPDAINLPFNHEVIRDGFVPVRPGDKEPEGAGFWAILQGNALVVQEGEGSFSLPEGERPAWLDGGSDPLCIGLWQGRPLRAASVAREAVLPPPFVAEPFNAVEDRLDDRLLTLGGLAQQVLQWERQSALCSRCGGAMERIAGSWGKRCLSCRHEHYPHIHPCVIVLVRRGEEFLLVRKAEWPAGRYSLIAGFVDFGESLEECVLREVAEEAGVAVTNVRYVGSQSWPFPSQLMAGFVADYAGGDPRPDRTEVEDARWFSIAAMPASLPAKRSIARWIIDTYALGLL